jgi:magnesium chelatase family protein
MYYSTKSTTVNGVDYTPINVEVTINNGIPNMRIVGLSDRSIQESKERIICAFRNSGMTIPAKKIRVNLAPSEIYKSGTGTDLAIACSILGCQNFFGNQKVFAFGELNMNGDINLAKGAFQFLQSGVNLCSTSFRI